MKRESAVYLQRQVATPEDFMVMVYRHYTGREVACPECRAKPMAPCENVNMGAARKGFRVSGSHKARIALAKEVGA
jgi:hypothetical protein